MGKMAVMSKGPTLFIFFFFLPYAGDERRRYGNRVSNCRLYSNFPAGGNSRKTSETQTPLLREIDRG